MAKVFVTFEINSTSPVSMPTMEAWAKKIVEQLNRAPDITAKIVTVTLK